MKTARPFVAIMVLALAACGSILPKPSPPPALYRLTALGAAGAPGRAVDAQLAVGLPTASAALDTDRIALARQPLSLDYFADAAWTDHAPAMVQTLIIQSLQNAGQIRVVAQPTGDMRADALLSCDLGRFEAHYARRRGARDRRRSLNARLVALPDRRVLAVHSFEGTGRPAANDMPQIVAGFDAALHDALGALLPWTAETLAAMKR